MGSLPIPPMQTRPPPTRYNQGASATEPIHPSNQYTAPQHDTIAGHPHHTAPRPPAPPDPPAAPARIINVQPHQLWQHKTKLAQVHSSIGTNP